MVCCHFEWMVLLSGFRANCLAAAIIGENARREQNEFGIVSWWCSPTFFQCVGHLLKLGCKFRIFRIFHFLIGDKKNTISTSNYIRSTINNNRSTQISNGFFCLLSIVNNCFFYENSLSMRRRTDNVRISPQALTNSSDGMASSTCRRRYSICVNHWSRRRSKCSWVIDDLFGSPKTIRAA